MTSSPPSGRSQGCSLPDADDSGGAAEVLQRMIAASAYRDLLQPIAADVLRVALLNDQVRTALQGLASQPARPARQASRSAEGQIVLAYLEHVAFASPAFLASVGEWPLRGRRG